MSSRCYLFYGWIYQVSRMNFGLQIIFFNPQSILKNLEFSQARTHFGFFSKLSKHATAMSVYRLHDTVTKVIDRHIYEMQFRD